MCGIVGLHLKTDRFETRLGALVSRMLTCMADRGPDSAGLALYGRPAAPGSHRYSLRAERPGADWDRLAGVVASAAGGEVVVERRAGDAVLEVAGEVTRVLEVLRDMPEVRLVGHGRSMEVFKDVGGPADICERYRIAERPGVRALGHTRMATESAVTTDHSHPFAPVADLCLVHNGSFSNYATVRRKLQREGAGFDTDNDSEVAARLLARQLNQGDGLEDALRLLLKELDGFFTLLVGTFDGFAVLRDSFACKPAVVAETADYVAVASEFQALAGLPGVADADVFEPRPEEIYQWTR